MFIFCLFPQDFSESSYWQGVQLIPSDLCRMKHKKYSCWFIITTALLRTKFFFSVSTSLCVKCVTVYHLPHGAVLGLISGFSPHGNKANCWVHRYRLLRIKVFFCLFVFAPRSCRLIQCLCLNLS